MSFSSSRSPKVLTHKDDSMPSPIGIKRPTQQVPSHSSDDDDDDVVVETLDEQPPSSSSAFYDVNGSYLLYIYIFNFN